MDWISSMNLHVNSLKSMVTINAPDGPSLLDNQNFQGHPRLRCANLLKCCTLLGSDEMSRTPTVS